ncbi:hemin uptake protein HemP [Methylomicrobium sp. RS1]|jgi:hemin uptake protein HemP|uniref:hemin uptake protein HemP n=1 Tax=Candidatus Methylomicrobium oryzae TaxID=2802053 RepID=UPI001924DA50|nr:hemin uptake protein HemP [Methylomicrobium sp. RS1]MBL1264867.1 hemin uptake protein HemP [Methylomicrobium sp. RS1]
MKSEKVFRSGGAVPPTESLSEKRRISSSALFGTRNEIVILHNEEEYRLRITSNGKLILTK